MVGTFLASQKFPAEHRLRLLLAGLFQLFFFAFSTFFCTTSVFSFFSFLCFLIFVVPSLFIREGSRQQLSRIFPKYTADTQPCDGPPSRLYYFSVGIGVTDVTKNSRLFAVTSTTCSTLLKELVVAVFSPPINIKQALYSPAHPVVSVPIRHPSDKESSVYTRGQSAQQYTVQRGHIPKPLEGMN